MNNKSLRWGYTTGSCAAAAAKSALLHLLHDWQEDEVEIISPEGKTIRLPVKDFNRNGSKCTAGIVKDAGDDPDVTNGLTINATVELMRNGCEIEIAGGRGVGRVTSPGLSVAVGEHAINPVPKEMIRSSVRGILPPGIGLQIIIEVPEGEEAAKRTFNPRLGIVGGISILGTTGFVRPMSQEAFFESLTPQLDQALALGYYKLILTPGGKGARRAASMGVDEKQIVQTGNFIGKMLDYAVQRKTKSVLLFGHLGKLVKVAAGIFNTNSRVADGRRETLAAHAALAGASRDTISEIMSLKTTEASIELFKVKKLQTAYHSLAEAASRYSLERANGEIDVGTIIYGLSGEVIGWDKRAEEIGEGLPWEIQLKL